MASNVSLPPGLAWTQKIARHTWAGTWETNLLHIDLDTLEGIPGPRELEKALPRGGGGGEIRKAA